MDDPETPREIHHCFVLTNADAPVDETRDVFASLSDAAMAINRNPPTSGSLTITFCESDATDQATTPAPSGRPAKTYYYDNESMGTSGDGTELDPWPSPSRALDEMVKLQARGKLSTQPGDSLVLASREPFTATRQQCRKQRAETIAKYLFLLMIIALVLPVLAILAHITYRAWPVLHWKFLVENPSNGMTEGGIWAPLVGTFFLIWISLLIAAPIGVLAGVYLNEYAKDNWFTRMINLAVVNLAGVPSIVHALFGVGAFVTFAGLGASLLAASCTLAVMTLPVIITSTREALASVPMSFREACWNMGASRWQTILTIVLPNSLSGILTGVILQVSRAAGETAPILFTGAAYSVPVPRSGWRYFIPYGINEEFMALSTHLYNLRTQVHHAPEELGYGAAVVLIGLVIAVNSVSIALRMRMRTNKKW